ncbi:MAG TPA: ROK family protein [Pirellulaceae bacterium]|nr:ROK family protein [Pirellulaceae bacterium]HMP68962.1 ROK family protein [Pirellulaceae bacterium]
MTEDSKPLNGGESQPAPPCWVGFDLGGTKMLASVFDQNFQKLGRAKQKSKGNEGVAAGLNRICKAIREAIDDAHVDPKQIAGIGIGCPGPLDLKKGILKTAPNLGWSNVPIRDHLQAEFGCPVIVANDVDAGVYGEYRFGAGKNARCVVGIFPGTGVGGGCVYEGKIIQGANCTCMEIGHLPLLPDGPLDGCNNAGSVEALASRLTIAAAAAQAAYRGQAPSLLESCGTDIRNIRSNAIAEAAAKEKSIRLIVEHAADHLALAVVSMIHLLAPDVIVLGGGLVEAMPELLCQRIEKSVRKRVLPTFADVFTIKIAKLGDDATACGAAAWAAQQIVPADLRPA